MNKLTVVEHKGLRVLTTSQLADVYGTDSNSLTVNFSRNKERFKEGKHYILLQGEELQNFKSEVTNCNVAPNVNKLYLWTEKGAWLHAKSLNTDKAWEAYELLVDEYYTIKEHQVRILSEREQLLASMKISIETAEEVGSIKGEIKEIRTILSNQVTLDHGQQCSLLNAKHQRVEQLWNENMVNKMLHNSKRKVHAMAWRDLKNAFGVASYRDVKQKEFKEALAYMKAWRPRMV
jgi:ribosomal protein L17